MPELSIEVPESFEPIFSGFWHLFAEDGGRDSGKTVSGVMLSTTDMLAHPFFDWIIFKAHYSDFRATDYAEVVSMINERGLGAEFAVLKSPFMIKRRNGSGNVYFMGADGADPNRTHGIKTEHPLKGAIFSETQQFRAEAAFSEALASLRRNFTVKGGKTAEDWKIIVEYNPPQSPGHWINLWALRKRADPDWKFIDVTYMDVLPSSMM